VSKLPRGIQSRRTLLRKEIHIQGNFGVFVSRLRCDEPAFAPTGFCFSPTESFSEQFRPGTPSKLSSASRVLEGRVMSFPDSKWKRH
jgi:hypothetical protein